MSVTQDLIRAEFFFIYFLRSRKLFNFWFCFLLNKYVAAPGQAPRNLYNIGGMLCQRLRRWHNITPAWYPGFVLAGSAGLLVIAPAPVIDIVRLRAH